MRTLPVVLAILLSPACELGMSSIPDKPEREPGDSSEPEPGDSGAGGGDSEPTDDPDDLPPVADAGPDQPSAVDLVTNLDGSGSYDPEGEDLAYDWEIVSMPSGSGVTLLNTTHVDPMFIPDSSGEYHIQLVVDDGAQSSPPDLVVITAEAPEDLPVANAGSDQQVNTGDTVTLDGSYSYDPMGENLGYSWAFLSVPTGSSATLSSASAVMPSFVADQDGDYLVELEVHDSTSTSDPDTVRITATTDEGGDDCGFGCARQAEIELKRRLGGTALAALPLFFGWRRRRLG